MTDDTKPLKLRTDLGLKRFAESLSNICTFFALMAFKRAFLKS
jgi:hypothetical protein